MQILVLVARSLTENINRGWPKRRKVPCCSLVRRGWASPKSLPETGLKRLLSCIRECKCYNFMHTHTHTCICAYFVHCTLTCFSWWQTGSWLIFQRQYRIYFTSLSFFWERERVYTQQFVYFFIYACFLLSFFHCLWLTDWMSVRLHAHKI